MSFEESPGFEGGAEVPDFSATEAVDFEIPKPTRSPSGKFARKPVGDRADTKKKTPVRIPNRKGQFVPAVTGFYMTVGGLLLPFDAVCGKGFMDAAPACGELWDELAYQNETVRRLLWSATQVSLTGKLFVAHSPIFIAVVLHHSPFADRLGEKMGAQFADTIAEQMRQAGESPE